MIKLIIIELKKIFHKKGIYIVWILLFIFCLINNILYKIDYDEEGYYINDYNKDNTSEINKIESKLLEYDSYNNEDYITLKTELDLLNIKNNYLPKTWQYNKIDYLYNDIYNVNYYTYIDNNPEKREYYNNTYNEKLTKFNNNDWKYFIQIERNELNSKIQELNNNQEQENLLNNYQKELEILEIRIENNIDYGINYLNDALLNYIDNKEKLTNYDDISKLDYLDKIEYNETVSNLNISKYIIDNKVNLNKENNLNYLLRTIIEDYQLFIIIVILLVAGSIVSEEITKGTIKLLLIKPFSRSKILLSKYLSSIIILLLTILLTIIMELIIGGYLFGFESLTMKVATYSYSTNTIVTYNIFIYMLIRIIYNLPLLLMILTICFGLSVIFNNTIIAVITTLLLYTFQETINLLAIKSNIHIFKYLLTINWDFKDYLFGGINKIQNISFQNSLFIYIIYLLIFIFIIFKVFKKKNIKNI